MHVHLIWDAPVVRECPNGNDVHFNCPTQYDSTGNQIIPDICMSFSEENMLYMRVENEEIDISGIEITLSFQCLGTCNNNFMNVIDIISFF